ncbi:MAG: hypothetical protein ACP5E3_11915 [Bacteroidales bacterium]
MKFADEYLAKQVRQENLIKETPAKNLNYIAVIPAFNESGLNKSLDSLYRAVRPSYPVEVIIVINWPFNSMADVVKKNHEIKKKADEWAKARNQDSLRFHTVTAEPDSEKKSGVGYARKIGMDEAVRRFNRVNSREGIILSLDADVEVNDHYFLELEKHFERFPSTTGCSTYFEHPLDQADNEDIRQAIIQYELHQRYYIQSLRYAGHPNVFHTVGSAFAVKTEAYCLQGGMNARKAGEDFYFLQKLFDLGNFTECNTAHVYPSPRPSERVPFGTGPVVLDYLVSKKDLLSFNTESFEILKQFIEVGEELYESVKNDDWSFLEQLHPLMKKYLEINDIEARLKEIHENSGDSIAFRKRFYRWFNMFRMLKFLNFGKSSFPDMPVRNATLKLLEKKKITPVKNDSESLLIQMRDIERNNPANPPLQQ